MNWRSEETSVLFNPQKYSAEEQARITEDLPLLPGHIWIESSGTTGASKWIALSKNAFLISAAAVNQHLQASAADRWLCALPTFHVGGLSIFARAELTGSTVISIAESRWNALDFYSVLEREHITLTSLVPTQVYDLVHENIPAPEKLRAVVVGGAALSAELYKAARRLGWPLLPSFGMTECCSQIATASLESLQNNTYPLLKILPHVELRLNRDDCVEVKSAALATMVVQFRSGVEISDPRVDGYWPTRDQVEITSESDPSGTGYLRFLQRYDDVVKIAGEQVSLVRLNSLLRSFAKASTTSADFLNKDSVLSEDQVLVATPSTRWGSQVDLVTTRQQFARLEPLLAKYNEKVLPLERIQNIYFLEDLPRTELGKIKTKDILKQIGF